MSKVRHLLDIQSLDDEAITWLLTRSSTIREYPGPGLAGMTVANLFYEPSTRTRISFERAAQKLGMSVVNMEADRASVSKGESLADTACTLHAMGIDCLVLRHPDSGAITELSHRTPEDLHLVNAGDGTRSHPSQALLDAMTLRRHGLDWRHATVAIIGDVRHSRVARSNIELLSRLDVNEIRIAGPERLLPDPPPAGVTVCHGLEEAVDGAHAVMLLRLQKERMSQAGWPAELEYHEKWGLRPHHLERAHRDCVVLHPGPINRGVEIAPEVADGPRSLIIEQVRNGVAMRMALFEWMARGFSPE